MCGLMLASTPSRRKPPSCSDAMRVRNTSMSPFAVLTRTRAPGRSPARSATCSGTETSVAPVSSRNTTGASLIVPLAT